MKIAIVTPGNENYLKQPRCRDAKIHRYRRSIYESLNKLGHLCDYIGVNDIVMDRLESYHAIFLLNHRYNDENQNQVLTSFLSKNKNIVMTYDTQAARDWGISSGTKHSSNQLNFKDQKLSYKVENIDNLASKINRKIFKNALPLERFLNLPSIRIASLNDSQVLAVWGQGGEPALVKLKKYRGNIIYFSGILAGTNDVFLKYILSHLEVEKDTVYPLMPNKKKCCVTIFYDYEGRYGNSRLGVYAKKGLQYILSAHKKYNIRATFNIVGKLCQTQPQSVKNIIDDGHEIASHTYEHIVPAKAGYKVLNASIGKNIDSFKADFAQNIRGFRSPESKWDKDLVSILEEYKFHWNAEDEAASLPYFLVLDRKLSVMRIPIACDDYTYISRHCSADYMLNFFKKTIEQGIKTSSYIAIGFHPWIEGMREENLNALKELLSYVSSNKHVEVMTFGEIFEWWSGRSSQ